MNKSNLAHLSKILLFALLTGFAQLGVAGNPGLDAAAIGKAAGTDATSTPDGVVHLAWSRHDVAVKVDGAPLDPAAGLGDRDGAIELDDRRRRHAGELAVQSRDLEPVGRTLHCNADELRFVLFVPVKHGVRHRFTESHVYSKSSVLIDARAAQHPGECSGGFIDGLDAAGQREFSRLYIHN